MGRAAFLIIALATAAMAVMTTGTVAHDEFGIPLDTIRTVALSAAGFDDTRPNRQGLDRGRGKREAIGKVVAVARD